MKKILSILAITISVMSCTEVNKKTVAGEKSPSADNAAVTPTMVKTGTAPKTAHGFLLTSIDGKQFSLKDYAGKKILIVNTASKCGYTPQYEALETLSKKYSDKLVVVGFPADNFGGQEPGSNKEIGEFCKKNYGVTFPLSEKISVVGENAAPLFQWLVRKEQNGVMDAQIKWNFTKFLLDERGNLLGVFPSKVTPMDDAIVSKL